jgi:hypothetical protein
MASTRQFTLPDESLRLEEINLPQELAGDLAGKPVVVKVLARDAVQNTAHWLGLPLRWACRCSLTTTERRGTMIGKPVSSSTLTGTDGSGDCLGIGFLLESVL